MSSSITKQQFLKSTTWSLQFNVTPGSCIHTTAHLMLLLSWTLPPNAGNSSQYYLFFEPQAAVLGLPFFLKFPHSNNFITLRSKILASKEGENFLIRIQNSPTETFVECFYQQPELIYELWSVRETVWLLIQKSYFFSTNKCSTC